MSDLLRRGWGIARSLLMYHGQPWRRRSLRNLYAGLVQPGDRVFDVGSHVGNRIGVLRSLGARVVAFEPQPDFFALLQKLYGSDPDVVLLPVGLGARPGRATLHISTATPTVSTFSAAWIDEVRSDPGFQSVSWDRRVEVEVRTLEWAITTYGMPAFCKIDVEGFEAEVLRGTSRALPSLSFEYIPSALGSAREVVELLAARGRYRFRRSLGESHRFCEPDWVDADTLLRSLARSGPGDPSGDVYARLEEQVPR